MILYLTCFNFTLIYKLDTSNKDNALSYRKDYKEGIENNNLNYILLESKFFRQIAIKLDIVEKIVDKKLKKKKRILKIEEMLRMLVSIGLQSLKKKLKD